MSSKQQELSTFWKIITSMFFLLPLNIIEITYSIFLVRSKISIYKINTPLEVILAAFFFPAAGLVELGSLMGIKSIPPTVQQLLLLAPIVYYGMLLLSWLFIEKYQKIVATILIIWSIFNIMGMPNLAAYIHFD